MASAANNDPTPELLSDKNTRSLSIVRAKEWIVKSGLVGCTLFSVLITVSIVVLLMWQSVLFFNYDEVTVSKFLFGTKWNPLLGTSKSFGVLPLVCGTLLVTVIAMMVALPLGLITAIFLSEYAPRRLRAVLKPILEVLAGIPTVVYGFFAISVITPFLKGIGIEVDFFNALSAGTRLASFAYQRSVRFRKTLYKPSQLGFAKRLTGWVEPSSTLRSKS